MAIPGSAPIMQFREESVVWHWIPSDLENVGRWVGFGEPTVLSFTVSLLLSYLFFIEVNK